MESTHPHAADTTKEWNTQKKQKKGGNRRKNIVKYAGNEKRHDKKSI
jgi:hypothetical protein